MISFVFWAVLAFLSTAANIVGQTCGIGGRPFLQVLFQAVFTNSFRDASEVIATVLWVNIVAFSLGVPGYNALGLYDSKLTLVLATVSVPSTILGCSFGDYLYDKHLRVAYAVLAACVSVSFFRRASKLTTEPPPAFIQEETSIEVITHPVRNFSTRQDTYSREGNFLDLERGDDVQNIEMLDDSDIENSSTQEELPLLQKEGHQLSHSQEELNGLLHNKQFSVKVVTGIHSEESAADSGGNDLSNSNDYLVGNESVMSNESHALSITESILEFRQSQDGQKRESVDNPREEEYNDFLSDESSQLEEAEAVQEEEGGGTDESEGVFETETLRITQSFHEKHTHVHWDTDSFEEQPIRRTVSDTGEGFDRMLNSATALSLASLSEFGTNAQSFVAMTARRHSLDSATSMRNIQAAMRQSVSYGTFQAITRSPTSPEFSGPCWPLLDLALALYERPALTIRDKTILCAGGLLCGALGVGVAESCLFVLVGFHDVPLGAAATGAISVAFYAQMTGTIMDSVKAAADATKPKLADSVPWGIVWAIIPGVAIGALIGPRLHAFDYEKNILLRAAYALAFVSVCVALIDNRLASLLDWGPHPPSDSLG